MLYMVWNLIKLAFQRNQPYVFWIFQDGVITKTLKTAQKTNNHMETTQKLISWKLVHIAYLFFSFSCLYLSRRAVPSINIHVLLSKRRLLIIEIQNPFVQLCANKYWERDLYPFALVISFAGLQKRRLHPLPIGAPTPFDVFSIDCRLCWSVPWECGWANPRFRLLVKDGGWLQVLFVRLH